ncbi:uracil-DNA glycosylase [Caldisphaera lagunensis DSM 15908]|uniref:Type-5 uracil-DNA glycosylase n=1 Tax=Caldisphaera lagunensis (strain DSM 15908 / JCM 11604 / ANMR 0165 / IC-154) TaxID=1056495 RepID=L0ACF6_CALLD|nr:uracil-DNA glycosylase [Caldisphaera lagunensis]AFZ70730.1 uracil-DNA glycosylase [Caldisphaera lagunensis DSM 15908]
MEDIEEINQKIISCRKCPRLINYINDVAKHPPKRFKDWNYWAKPVPSFGDKNAEIAIVGLAPAANGGNRTGRVFTGDHSGDWLFKALYETGFANKPTSISKDDGLEIKNIYITAVIHCAPPQNKPNKDEISNCLPYLLSELKLLKNLKVIITLGKIAFDTITNIYNVKYEFKHLAVYDLPGNKKLIASYHPSARNTNTGLMGWEQWVNVFKKAKELIGE